MRLEQRRALEAFDAALARHPRGGPAEGRLVVAQPQPGGLRPTMERALRTYMKPEDYVAWRQQQVARPVATAGKTFVAKDAVITACVCPMPETSALLGIAAHELIETAHLAAQRRAGARPLEAHEINGTTLADEYIADRLRIELATELGWPRSSLDTNVGLVSQTNDIEALLSRPPYDGLPTTEFWQHWMNLARVWAMVSGRADAGGRTEAQELERWADHHLIADGGWQPVRQTLRRLYGPPEPSREPFIAMAVKRVFSPIEAYGGNAWAAS